MESQCNRVIMLITCDASAKYIDAFSDNNLPGREVRIHLFIMQSMSWQCVMTDASLLARPVSPSLIRNFVLTCNSGANKDLYYIWTLESKSFDCWKHY